MVSKLNTPIGSEPKGSFLLQKNISIILNNYIDTIRIMSIIKDS